MEITDKTHVVLMMNDVRVYITQEQADNLKKLLSAQNCPRYVEIGEELINTNSIVSVSSAVNLKLSERVKRGDWMCKYGHWHTRGEECGHNLQYNEHNTTNQ